MANARVLFSGRLDIVIFAKACEIAGENDLNNFIKSFKRALMVLSYHSTS